MLNIKKKKGVKVLSLLLTLQLAVVCTFSSSADIQKVSATGQGRSYSVYNASTHILENQYTLNSPYSTMSLEQSRNAIGTDTREIDNTKSGVVKLCITDNGHFYSATGFVLSDHVIATAAHCLCSGRNIRNISDILLFNSNGEVSLHATADEFHIPNIYMDTIYGNRNYDYALITVEEDLSDYMMFDLATITTGFTNYSNSVENTVYITGFPDYGPNNCNNTANQHYKFTGSGNTVFLESNQIYVNTDASSGNSGSPMYTIETYNNKTYYSVVGIYASYPNSINIDGVTMNFPTNAGTRITSDILCFYNNNLYI